MAPGRYTLAQLGLDPAVTARQTITSYLETVQASAAAGDTRITVSLEGAPAGIGNLTDVVRVTAADLDIQRKTGDAWEDAGDMVSRYRPNPVVTVPDLTQVPAAELTAAAPAKRFLVGGSTKGGISDVLVEYTYRGRVIQTDRVAFRVTDVAGLAGIPLSGPPDSQYVHTFNHTQPSRSRWTPRRGRS